LLNKFADEFGLDRVEGKQKVKRRRSGTTWTIDAKGFREKNEAFVIVECRRYITSKQNQEKVGSLAYRIIDTGAGGGILVSPLGMQKGAKKIANAENIIHVQLDENSRRYEYVLGFLNKIMLGIQDAIRVEEKVRVKIVNDPDK
jgi:Restriction endonuclease